MKLFKSLLTKGLFFIPLTLIFLFIIPVHANTEGIQVYQKNMHLSQEHKKKLAADIYRYYNASDFWEELRHGFILPHYEYMPQVQEQITWLWLHQDFLRQSTARAAPYLYYILQQVRKRHLPAELVLLPIMESSYNPFAYSTVGAAGIWQMMPRTATGFGIKQNWWYDGRRDVVISTRAALNYVAYLGSYFGGNWMLAIAAYDTGEGNVLNAVRRNIHDGKTTDFWSLPLSKETREYIPRLLALATIISYPDRYPIILPPVRNAPYLAQIDIGGQIDLKQAATLAGLSLKKLKQLNPGYNRSATDPDGPFKIVLPIEKVQQFTENLSHLPSYPSINWHAYTVKKKDTWESIAKRFNSSIASLRQANPIRLADLIPGKHIVIPHASYTLTGTILAAEQPAMEKADQTILANHTTLGTAPAQPQLIASATPSKPPKIIQENNTIANALANLQGKYALQPGDTLYMIREGDNLGKIARRYHMDARKILAVNQLNEFNSLQPGEKIIIPTHVIQASVQNDEYTHDETIYMVGQNETIDGIAQKFHTSAAAIRIANLLSTNELRTGDRLVIPQTG